MLSKFAKDCKTTSHNVNYTLHKVENLSDRWNIKYKKEKCDLLNAGRTKNNFAYSLSGCWHES